MIGGLQHHGNIGKKAVERAYGTLIGAGLGLLVVMQQAYLGIPLLTYSIMALACGFFAYHAIGKGGYTALLSAITLFVVAGHGYNPMSDGLWRAVDILIGIALALAFSFALPLYAVYSWRYNLARALRECATVYGRIVNGQSANTDEQRKLMAKLNATMVQLRSLMPSVSKEVKISITELEAIQGYFRMCLSTLEILANIRPCGGDEAAMARLQALLAAEHRAITRQLIAMARALQGGATERLERRCEPALLQPSHAGAVANELVGYQLLTRQLLKNLDGLQQLLAKTARRWKI
ncbi:Inner membrane protein YeeA [compost metagenome]